MSLEFKKKCCLYELTIIEVIRFQSFSEGSSDNRHNPVKIGFGAVKCFYLMDQMSSNNSKFVD